MSRAASPQKANSRPIKSNLSSKAGAPAWSTASVAGRVHPRQLAFSLPHAESLSRDNFLEGPANAAGLALIDSWPEWTSRIMWLAGPEGSGKSHLAAIWAEDSGARSTTANGLAAEAVPGGLV